ncbi:putative domain 1-containing protein [Williamsia serinedens]|uniref:Domain 1-containing protein n=1 Tax=Williamsia serinedens TaxID=391736 RepID=A0ABT1GXK4_9NOCA|nr:putative domain 1-containing protein [Williamsia serinedens]
MSDTTLPVLEYLRRHVAGTLGPDDRTFLRYPTAISRLLGFEITEVDAGTATLTVVTDPELHSNQQGTVHGGFISELADAAIGTARSTTIAQGESFTSIDLRITFLRPMWAGTLTARAHPTHIGSTVQHYACDITRDDGKTVATATSTVLTLRGEKAAGR